MTKAGQTEPVCGKRKILLMEEMVDFYSGEPVAYGWSYLSS